MQKLFSFSSPIYAILAKLADLMLVSILWTVFCVPIFTIGASTTALYRVVLKIKDDKVDSTVRQFWEAFKANFKAGTKVMLLSLPAYAIMGLEIWVLLAKEIPHPVANACIVSSIVIGLCLIYVFPLTAQYDNTAFQTIKNSFIFAVSSPLRSLFVFAINMLPAVAFALMPYAFFYVLPIWFIMGAGVAALINVSVLRGILKVFTKSEDAAEEISES